MPRGSRRASVVVIAIAVVAAACTSSSAPLSSTASGPSSAPRYYVSLGDSYASGLQPKPGSGVSNTRNGFAYQLVDKLRAAGTDVELVNFGCAGATSQSILHGKGCDALGPDGHDYPDRSQADAAEDFLRNHRGAIALVTVSIGGNDIALCTTNPDQAACLTSAVAAVTQNVSVVAHGVRDAAGDGVPIIGTTYPDVALAGWLTGSPDGQRLAALSVSLFQTMFNPALDAAYTSVDGTFVDITAASGAYGPLSETTTLDPYGTIPVPVAKVCQLTFICELQNIHPTTAGYTFIADQVLAAFLHR